MKSIEPTSILDLAERIAPHNAMALHEFNRQKLFWFAAEVTKLARQELQRFHHASPSYQTAEGLFAYTLNSSIMEGSELVDGHVTPSENYMPRGALMFISHDAHPADGDVTLWKINGNIHVGVYLQKSQTLVPDNSIYPIESVKSAIFIGTLRMCYVSAMGWTRDF